MLQLQHLSLHRRVVSPTLWMLQIRSWSIVTWEFFTMFYTSWCTTGLHVGHACPSRHVNMQISEDTCEDAFAPQKHMEFERQASFSDLSQDTVRTSVTKVAQLIFLQTLQVALSIDGKISSLSITTEKTGDSPLQHGLASCLPPYLPPWCLFWISWKGWTRFDFKVPLKKTWTWTWTHFVCCKMNLDKWDIFRCRMGHLQMSHATIEFVPVWQS